MAETVHSKTANIVWMFILPQLLGQGTATIEFWAGYFFVLGSVLCIVGCSVASLPLSTRWQQLQPTSKCDNQQYL